jgi:NAD+ synthase
MDGTSLALDAASEERRIASFIRRVVSRSGAKGAAVGLSGGVDSAVVGRLCVGALGRDRVLGVLMPSAHTPSADLDDASRLAAAWGIARVTVPISPVVEAIVSAAGPAAARIAAANVQARVRMTLLYYFANARGLLVAGTGDRSEETIGFFTKYGDGGVDFLPIAHLYKTQVRAMARHLGIPEGVAEKPASPQLWPGHTAEQELPAGYEKLDLVMHMLFDRGAAPAAAARGAGVDREVVDRLLEMHAKSAHKRSLPPSLRPPRA